MQPRARRMEKFFLSLSAFAGVVSGLALGDNPLFFPSIDPPTGQVISRLADNPALVGYYYDLKQTSDDPPRPTNITQADWRAELLKLVANNLQEDSLKKFFRGPQPRNAIGFFIPEQAYKNAAIGFGLGDKVQPNLWVIVYHGKAVAPETGRFRFVGFGDDVLVVFKDKHMVLDAGWQRLSNRADLHHTYENIWSKEAGANCKLRQGEWFDVTKGQVINLDVALGDWGGLCAYFLLLEKDGAKYDILADGTPKLPLFQIGAEINLPSGPDLPPVEHSNSVWPVADVQ